MYRYGIIFFTIFLVVFLSLQMNRAEVSGDASLTASKTVNPSTAPEEKDGKESPVPPETVTPSPSQTPTPVPTPPVINTPAPVATQKPEMAPVMLNQKIILKVVGDSGMSASERASIIEKRLEEVLQRTDKPPYVVVKVVDGNPVMEAEGIFIMSVTNSDASANNSSLSILAGLWRDALGNGLASTLRERSQGYTKEAIMESFITLIAGILLTVIVVFIFRRFFKEPGHFLVLIIWLGIISHILWIFPVSRLLSRQIVETILQPVFTLFLLIFILSLLFNPVDRFVKYSAELSEKLKGHELEKDLRSGHRLKMRWMVVSVLVKAGMIIFSAIVFLKLLKVNMSAGLTGAGILGVGLSLIFQDLCKDFFAGMSIVIEDQFSIGDHIRTGNVSGMVEDFNLRSTRIRDSEGRLITISNSLIRSVENSSSIWSQIDFSLFVSYSSDLKKAMEIMLETAKKLKDELPDKILTDPVMLGVDELSDSGVKIRMFIKTAPLQQWNIKRELLLRVKNRFDEEKIRFAFTYHTLFIQKEK